uniref:Toll-like receptor 3 n=1 Tax=Leguminivora glycinivorella TaxID=1035111 RepID=A0A346RAG3_9NEOP|nr:toll-like receptor 3 [Leguminivora glycinivorella]
MNIYAFVICNCLAMVWGQQVQPCLTGSMTDIQPWVDRNGRLKPEAKPMSIDVSESRQPMATLELQLNQDTRNPRKIRILSMARCSLRTVPEVFSLQDANQRPLSEVIEYLTLYGNKFDDHQSTGDRYDSFLNATEARVLVQSIAYDTREASWPGSLKNTRFKNLRELDLRACAIATLSIGTFQGMEKLEALYLSENSIVYIDVQAFSGLKNLAHLDMSRNYHYDDFGNYKSLVLDSMDAIGDLNKLVSLDLSYTRLSLGNLMIFNSFGKTFQRLSLCETGLTKLRDNMFRNTSIRFLDVSGNNGILNQFGALSGLENTLEVLYAVKVGLVNLNVLDGFKRLEILSVQNNEISLFTNDVTKTLVNLQILNLDYNRMTTWLDPKFSHMKNLKYLSLRKNNINMINENMLQDLKNIEYLGLSENFVICNCHTRELFETALITDRAETNRSVLISQYKKGGNNKFSSYHTGFEFYNAIIDKRTNVNKACEKDKTCDTEIHNDNITASYVLVDYDPNLYVCMQMIEGVYKPFSQPMSCDISPRDVDFEVVMDKSRMKLLALIIIPAILFPMLYYMFIFRKNFRYFCITVRNSALLSMINKDKIIDDSRIFNYDVFVSYCNDDRGWILDQLLPHLETNCGVSVCLHERDFQVGLSILENIVSCMDRSRSIMLVISKEFLLSQWCQFEMHLAQHRLLETRREDLMLVLLEEIPRRLRPTTLHYLMLTKTYIVYPNGAGESVKKDFWRRLGRSVTARRPDHENDSLA